MNVTDAIRTKRAIRLFTDQPLPAEAVAAILNAGRRELLRWRRCAGINPGRKIGSTVL